MKTNNNFRKFGDDSQRGGQVKGKMPVKEKKLKRSIYEEIEEDEEIGYRNLKKKESIEDYLDDEHEFLDNNEFEDSEFDSDEDDSEDDSYEDEDWFEDDEDEEWDDDE